MQRGSLINIVVLEPSTEVSSDSKMVKIIYIWKIGAKAPGADHGSAARDPHSTNVSYNHDFATKAIQPSRGGCSMLQSKHHSLLLLPDSLLCSLLSTRKADIEAAGVPFPDPEQIIQGNRGADIEDNVRPNDTIIAPSVTPKNL